MQVHFTVICCVKRKPYTFRCKIQIIWLKITYFIGMSQFFVQFCLVQLTDCCLVQLTDFVVTGTDKGFYTGMILIDLQKAFDMLDHTVLLQKMECIGFRQSVIKWFQSYVIQIIFCGTRRCIFRCWGSFDYCCFWSISEIHTSTPSKPLQRNPFIQSWCLS